MKLATLVLASLALCDAFQQQAGSTRPSSALFASPAINEVTSRKDFAKALVAGGLAISAATAAEPAVARGRATLEQSYQRYAPRIRAGGLFYASDLKQLVGKNDWQGIKSALAEPPSRSKSDLNKPDAGVAERARQAGGFSDARVLVAGKLS